MKTKVFLRKFCGLVFARVHLMVFFTIIIEIMRLSCGDKVFLCRIKFSPKSRPTGPIEKGEGRNNGKIETPAQPHGSELSY